MIQIDEQRILFEDNHLIIVNKKAGELVQETEAEKESLENSIKAFLTKKYNKPGDSFLGVVHRIDRPTSGLIIFAKTSKALARMNELFKSREVKKKYLAIVKHKPSESKANLIHYLLRDSKSNMSKAHTKEVAHSQKASLDYKIIASSDKYHLLEVDLHTGRHHQIRAQLSKIGSPIKGDLKYGAERSNPDGSISLHAYSTTFMHPVKKEEITIIAPPPSDNLWNALYKKP